jgi:TetR/AcrR family transcriptional regulator, transcriptional repressor of aconitase
MRTISKPKADTSEDPTPLSRKESQAQTRARLIAVGREHFLRYGLGGSVAEKIAAEAGFTRGALYANFRNKDELFLAVMQSSVETEMLNFRSILASKGTAQDRFRMMREAVGNLVTNPAWVLLQAEFQAKALRDDAVRVAFLKQQERRRADGASLLREFANQLGLALSASPEEIAEVLSSLTEGLAVRQAISDKRDPQKAKQLAMLCFDRLVSVRSGAIQRTSTTRTARPRRF